jgi:hypothetical protein
MRESEESNQMAVAEERKTGDRCISEGEEREEGE